MKLYSIHQNNSGGSFQEPAANIYCFAKDKAEALEKFGNHITFCGDSDLYAEYDNCGCCPCCGHRWDKYISEMDKEYVNGLFKGCEKEEMKYFGFVSSAFVEEDGSLLIGDTEEKFTRIKGHVERYVLDES